MEAGWPRARAQCRVYSEPEAEMVRQAVTEAAIVQAVGRARGVNRTEADPVEVFLILDDTVTDRGSMRWSNWPTSSPAPSTT